MQGSLYIVDAFNFLFRAFHALPPLRTHSGLHTGAIYGLCQMLLRIEREHQPSHLCTVFDTPGPTARTQIYAEYKAHRPPMPPELREQVDLVPQVLSAFGIASVRVPGTEADDVIATVTRLARERGLQVVICSSDKDLMQLVRPGVSLLDTMKNRMIGPEEVVERWGVAPEQVGDLLALVGDSVDNVPGVPDVGPKTAAQWLKRFGTLDAVLANAEQIGGKRGQALSGARDVVSLARRLVALDDQVPLAGRLEDLQRVEPDATALQGLFRDLEFSRLESQIAARRAQANGATPDNPANLHGTASEASVSVPPTPSVSARPDSTPGSNIPADVPSGVVNPAVTPVPQSPPVSVSCQVISDRQALPALVAAVQRAGHMALTLLCEDASLGGEWVALAIACGDGQRFVIPVAAGRAQGLLNASPALPESDVIAVLGPLLQDSAVRTFVHDGKALRVFMADRGVKVRNVAFDTMLAAYLLDASRTRHDLDTIAHAEGMSGVDTRATWLGSGRTARARRDIPAVELGQHLGAEAGAILALARIQDTKLRAAGLHDLFAHVEMPLSDVLADIERTGIRIDTAFLKQLSQETARGIAALEREIHQLAGSEFNIGSPKQLQKILFEKLGLPILRKTKTGASTDAEVLEELAPMHPVPAKILDYRSLTKLKSTYLDALPSLVNPRTGRLHTTFNQAVAATGRLSSSDPNLQNIPIRTELGRSIRRAFVTDPGRVILSADYSQIELRILAHYSEDPVFLDAFRSGADIHQRTAAEVFGVSLDTVTAEQRRIAKAINFGLVFGQSDYGLSQALRIPRAEAKSYIENYFVRYAGVKAYMDRAIVDARAHGEVTTLLGRRRPIPELGASRAQLRAQGERIARNTPIQGSAADILKLAMIAVARGLHDGRAPGGQDGARLLLTVHDELVFEVKEAVAEPFAAWVRQIMESAYHLKVPLVVEVGWGPTWADAH